VQQGLCSLWFVQQDPWSLLLVRLVRSLPFLVRQDRSSLLVRQGLSSLLVRQGRSSLLVRQDYSWL
jgi:hypothetical protein